MTSNGVKYKVLILILIAAAGFYFFGGDLRLDRLEKIAADRLAEIQKEINAPPPLRGPLEDRESFLTAAGVVKWTSAHRAQNGLPPLKVNLKLNSSARAKVDDMFSGQYFAHEAPNGETVEDLANAAGYSFIAIGENLALGNYEDDETLVQAWMDSPGHRANILNDDYKEIGVSVKRGQFEGRTTWLAVQHFGRPFSDCPHPDTSLKDQIETNNQRIEQMRAELEAKKQEIDDNEDVREYNALVKAHNELVEQNRGLAETYNQQVAVFNTCVKN